MTCDHSKQDGEFCPSCDERFATEEELEHLDDEDDPEGLEDACNRQW